MNDFPNEAELKESLDGVLMSRLATVYGDAVETPSNSAKLAGGVSDWFVNLAMKFAINKILENEKLISDTVTAKVKDLLALDIPGIGQDLEATIDQQIVSVVTEMLKGMFQLLRGLNATT